MNKFKYDLSFSWLLIFGTNADSPAYACPKGFCCCCNSKKVMHITFLGFSLFQTFSSVSTGWSLC